jgi:hypothetical protein
VYDLHQQPRDNGDPELPDGQPKARMDTRSRWFSSEAGAISARILRNIGKSFGPLADSPRAFASSYVRAKSQSDAIWQERIILNTDLAEGHV